MTRILVVEDDPSIRLGLEDTLRAKGYEVEATQKGVTGAELAATGRFDLVILDVMLPDIDGFEVCRRIRGGRGPHARVPVIMLSARGAEIDRVRGLEIGADDYVTKPFSVAELSALVEALLRRAGVTERDPDAPPFAFGPWQVDRQTRVARRGEEQVELTQLEAALAELFASEQGRILSRRRLLREVWDVADPERIETRTVDMHVAKLRKKLGAAGAALIQTVRGEGYRFGA